MSIHKLFKSQFQFDIIFTTVRKRISAIKTRDVVDHDSHKSSTKLELTHIILQMNIILFHIS